MNFLKVLVGMIFLFFLWSFIEKRRITKTQYIIDYKGNGHRSKDISFVLLSDLHNNRYGKNNQALLNKILDKKPDFVIIAGDLITKRKPSYPSNSYDLLEKLIKHFPVYYAYGNHEQYFEDMTRDRNIKPVKNLLSLSESWLLYKDMLLKLGVHILDNESILVYNNDNKIRITGLSISSDYYLKKKTPKLTQEELISKVGKGSNEDYQILIAHNPMYFKEYTHWGADLILSGHVHGGLIRLPFIGGVISPQIRLFPKYDSGVISENNKHMVVSRGAGDHSFMPRFLNPPELVIITLKAK